MTEFLHPKMYTDCRGFVSEMRMSFFPSKFSTTHLRKEDKTMLVPQKSIFLVVTEEARIVQRKPTNFCTSKSRDFTLQDDWIRTVT
jgi:hypothetical protein